MAVRFAIPPGEILAIARSAISPRVVKRYPDSAKLQLLIALSSSMTYGERLALMPRLHLKTNAELEDLTRVLEEEQRILPCIYDDAPIDGPSEEPTN